MYSAKGLVRPWYTFLTVSAFVIALVLLSLTQPQTAVSSPESIDLDNQLRNVTVPEGSLPNTSVSPDIAPREGNIEIERKGWIAELARGLYSLISGKEIAPPSISTPNIPSDNITDKNTSIDSGNSTDVPDDFNLSRNDSQESPKDPSQDLGFIKKFLKSIMGIFDLSGAKSNTTLEAEPPKSGGNISDPEPGKPAEKPDENDKDQSDGTDSNDRGAANDYKDILGDISGFDKALPVLFVLLATFGLYWAYRNDVDPRELVRKVFYRLKNFIVALPDIFQRLIVKAISLTSDALSKIFDKLRRLIQAPVSFIQGVIESLKHWKASIIKRIRALRDKGLLTTVKTTFQKKSDDIEGIGLTWQKLKKKSGLLDRHDLTPVEVGEEAVARGLENNIVEEIVDAYRWEKYSPSGYPGELKNSYWRKELGDDDE